MAEAFSVVLSGLTPGTSYEVQAIFESPYGVAYGFDDTISAAFLTEGAMSDVSRRGKHYVHKVYGWEGEYRGTWLEAQEPEFSTYINGGVSDISIRLPRTISQRHNDPTIDFGNQVDIWAFDYRSNGLGPNLIHDTDMNLGLWQLDAGVVIDEEGGPDGSRAIKIVGESSESLSALSEVIAPRTRYRDESGAWTTKFTAVPYVITAVCSASGGKLRFRAQFYDAEHNVLEVSDQYGETIGTGWQRLKFTTTPPEDTEYMRLVFQNDGDGIFYADKVEVHAQEHLIYRGRIEGITTSTTQEGQWVDIEILGLVSDASNQVIPFKQYVGSQPPYEQSLGLPFSPPTDPANMVKDALDRAVADEPRFALWYDEGSIDPTGAIGEYTFRDVTIRDMMDRAVSLSPAGWYYVIDADGKVHYLHRDNARRHRLRLNVEIMSLVYEQSISDLKNHVIVRGKQETIVDAEPGAFGSINYETVDLSSVQRYQLRTLVVSDTSLTDPATAELMGEGQLADSNKVTLRANAAVPDEKDITYTSGALRGANIEEFRPGDIVDIIDPVAGAHRTYWDEFEWDVDTWDDRGSNVLPDSIIIQSIAYRGSEVILELGERQESVAEQVARMQRYVQHNAWKSS